MVIGTLGVSLLLRESRSLKDKRQVVRSIIDRLRHDFHVAIAEVDNHDDAKLISLGIAAVGYEHGAVKGILQKIQDALRIHPVAEYCQSEIRLGRGLI